MMKFLTLSIVLFSVISCRSIPEEKLNHVVLIWFKAETSEAYIKTVEQESKELKKIPGVLDLQLGRAIDSKRKIVDDSFHLGLLFQFNSKSELDAYIKHPRHQKFVESYIKGKAKKIVVYDF
mgnify:CR=1 FL=1